MSLAAQPRCLRPNAAPDQSRHLGPSRGMSAYPPTAAQEQTFPDRGFGLAGMDRSSPAAFFGLALSGPGHFDDLRSMSMVATSRANLAIIADQPQTRTRRTCQLLPFQKRCVTHSQL